MPNTASLVGSQIGNYEVVERLGQGGMGDVYLGRHPAIGREVAIKVLAPELCSDPRKVLRFQQEAQAVCRIGHPDIVTVLDFGQLPSGQSYYVMERLTGSSLRDHLTEHGALEPAEVLRLITPVLQALGAAHAQGIVHRDIKPENIFLQDVPGGPPQARLLDFGIAKLLETGSEPPLLTTNTGVVLGTPLYLSPEQAAGGAQAVGPYTDVYGLGCLLFEMLAGRPPFVGEGLGEVLVQQLQSAPPSLRQLRPELSAGLDEVLQTALAKPPQARYQTMDGLLSALTGAITGGGPKDVRPVARQAAPGNTTALLPDAQDVTGAVTEPAGAPPAVALPEPGPPARRSRPGLVVALVGSALVVGVVGGYVFTRRHQSAPAPDKAAPGAPSTSAMSQAARGLRPRRGTARPRHRPIVHRVGGITLIQTKGKSRFLRPNHDPKRFDALGFLAKAQKLARQWRPDAVLVDLVIPGVYPDGRVDLTVTERAEVEYQFRSPAESKRDPTKPRNVEQDIPCMYNVEVRAQVIETYVSTSTTCQELPLPGNRCNLRQAWQRALLRGAPRGNVVAKMTLMPKQWYFDFGEKSISVPDTCP